MNVVIEQGIPGEIDSSVRLLHSDDAPIVIGDHLKVYRGGEIAGPVAIGDRVFINRDVYIRPHTTIGDDVNLGPFVRIITDSHEIGPAQKRAGRVRFEPVSIGSGTWLGANVTVLPGISIGSGCIVAAGAVVTSNVGDNQLVGGVPARIIRSLEPPEVQPAQKIGAQPRAGFLSRLWRRFAR